MIWCTFEKKVPEKGDENFGQFGDVDNSFNILKKRSPRKGTKTIVVFVIIIIFAILKKRSPRKGTKTVSTHP